MGCQIITGKDESGMEVACFYDSVTDACFGVILTDFEEAESFQKDCKVDLRTLKHEEFVELLNKFREKRENEKLKV